MWFKKLLPALFLLLIGAFSWQVGSYYLSPEIWVKLDQFTRVMLPFLPGEEVSLTGVSTANSCLGQDEVVKSVTKILEIDSINELGLIGSDDSVVKWRENVDEPYRGYPLEAANEYVIEGETVENFANKIGDGEALTNILGDGYTVYPEMNIPLYKYPSGEMAKKIGIKHGNERYLIGIFGTEIGDHGLNKSPHVKIFCADPSQVTVQLYSYYLDLPHKYTSETSVVYEDLGNNLSRVNLIYPGASLDYQASEFWDTTKKPWRKVYEMGQFPPCALFENLRIGADSSCYLPEKKEFSVITY